MKQRSLRDIYATFDRNSIIVYQAYSPAIAELLFSNNNSFLLFHLTE